jgi:hypothetical protein
MAYKGPPSRAESLARLAARKKGASYSQVYGGKAPISKFGSSKVGEEKRYIQGADGRFEGSLPSLTTQRKLSSEESAAVDRYARGGAYEYVNSDLRLGRSINLFSKEELAALDSAVKSQTFVSDSTVYRAVSEKFASKLKVGSSFIDKGYLSTSASKRGVDYFSEDEDGRMAVFEIRVKKNTPALEVSKIGLSSIHKHEEEILFGRGSRLKIQSISKRPDGVSVYKAALTFS